MLPHSLFSLPLDYASYESNFRQEQKKECKKQRSILNKKKKSSKKREIDCVRHEKPLWPLFLYNKGAACRELIIFTINEEKVVLMLSYWCVIHNLFDFIVERTL